MASTDAGFLRALFPWRAPQTTSRETCVGTTGAAVRGACLRWKQGRGVCAATLAAALAAGALIAGFSEARAQTSDQERLQGAWECVVTLKDGKQVKDFVGARAVMRGNTLAWHIPGPEGKELTTTASFTIDASQNPKHFDWYEENPPRVHRRLYVLAGDVLIWSTDLGDAPRPQHFAAGRWQFVMRRIGN